MIALIWIAGVLGWFVLGTLVRPLIHRFDDTMIGFGTDCDDAGWVAMAVTMGPLFFATGLVLLPFWAVGWLVFRHQCRPRSVPVYPPAPGCRAYGACGHCGARGGGECLLWYGRFPATIGSASQPPENEQSGRDDG